MTKQEVVQAIGEYAQQYGLEMAPAAENVIEMKFEKQTGKRLFVKYEMTQGESAWITVQLLVGHIGDLRACVRLFFLGRWPGTSFYLMGKRAEGVDFLFAETFIHFYKHWTVEQATHELCLVAGLEQTFLSRIEWPDGVEVYL